MDVKIRKNKYDRVMSRMQNRSRSSLKSTSCVTRHDLPSSVRVAAKPSVSNVTSSVFSELPIVLNDYVPESSVDPVKRKFVMKSRKTVTSLNPTLSPPRPIPKRNVNPSLMRVGASAPSVLVPSGEKWSDSHYRECLSSRSHTRLKELKDEIKAFHQTEKLMKHRSHVYKSCGIVLDDVGNVAEDKAIQVGPTDEVEADKKTEIRHKKWLELINREDLLSRHDFKCYSYSVCSDHFEESSFKKGLRSGANPIKVSTEKSEASSSHTQAMTCAQIKADVGMKSYTSTGTQTEALEQLVKQTPTSKSASAQGSLKRKFSKELRNPPRKSQRLDKDIEITKSQITHTYTHITKDK